MFPRFHRKPSKLAQIAGRISETNWFDPLKKTVSLSHVSISETFLSLSGGVFAEIYFTRFNSLFALLETLFMILDDAYRTLMGETDTRHLTQIKARL